jgi:hypothetical protein
MHARLLLLVSNDHCYIYVRTLLMFCMGRMSVRQMNVLLDELLNWSRDSFWESAVTDSHVCECLC